MESVSLSRSMILVGVSVGMSTADGVTDLSKVWSWKGICEECGRPGVQEIGAGCFVYLGLKEETVIVLVLAGEKRGLSRAS